MGSGMKPEDIRRGSSHLTPEELEMLRLLVAGWTDGRIAKGLRPRVLQAIPERCLHRARGPILAPLIPKEACRALAGEGPRPSWIRSVP